VETNLEALHFALEPALLDQINTVASPAKGLTWPSGRPENSNA
jgi:hypothetical protein